MKTKSIVFRMVMIAMISFFLTSCYEGHYYREHHEHSDRYYHHHHRVSAGVDIHIQGDHDRDHH